MKLYNYFRSSASFRVRIALNLKGLAYEYIPVHIAKGLHKTPEFSAISDGQLVPVLEVNGQRLSQSLAIIDYLDEVYPAVPLLPTEPHAKARVRALAQTIACEIHPLNNLRVLKYLTHDLKVDDDAKNTWYRHWTRLGLEAFERQLKSASLTLNNSQNPHTESATSYCFGSKPGLADCCLVPQIFNAQRFKTPLDGLPLSMAAFDACMRLEAFQKAQPSQCPDNEP
jgi:maleylacetoacetate isomerase